MAKITEIDLVRMVIKRLEELGWEMIVVDDEFLCGNHGKKISGPFCNECGIHMTSVSTGSEADMLDALKKAELI